MNPVRNSRQDGEEIEMLYTRAVDGGKNDYYLAKREKRMSELEQEKEKLVFTFRAEASDFSERATVIQERSCFY